jgi:hypothetical protein
MLMAYCSVVSVVQLWIHRMVFCRGAGGGAAVVGMRALGSAQAAAGPARAGVGSGLGTGALWRAAGIETGRGRLAVVHMKNIGIMLIPPMPPPPSPP